MKSNNIFFTSDRFVLRDIAGIYFAVDIKNKRLYDDKILLTLNKTGYILLSIAAEKKSFTTSGLTDSFIKMLAGNFNDKEVRKDISDFISFAEKKGLIERYE